MLPPLHEMTSYEQIVYLETVDELTAELIPIVQKYANTINDSNARSVIIAAALGTVAQFVGQATYKYSGITGTLLAIAKSWTK